MIKKFSKLSLLIVAVLIFFGFFAGDKARAAIYSCTHKITSFNVSPNLVSLTGDLNLRVVVNRSDTICLVGRTDYKAYFFYISTTAGSAGRPIGIQNVTSYSNGDTQISLDIVPGEVAIAKGSYIFWAQVEVKQDPSLTFKSDGVPVDVKDETRPKFSCDRNNQCVAGPAGQYPTEADCQRRCGRPGGKGGGEETGGGGRETATRSIEFEFKNPIANDDLIGLVKSIAAWIYKLAIPVAVVAIIYGGGLLMLSQGNTKMIERGRKVLLYAVIGLVIIFIGRGFFTLIKSILDLGR